jgi:hypothetical protein
MEPKRTIHKMPVGKPLPRAKYVKRQDSTEDLEAEQPLDFLVRNGTALKAFSEQALRKIIEADEASSAQQEQSVSEAIWEECQLNGTACSIRAPKTIEKDAPARLPRSLVTYERPRHLELSVWEAQLKLAWQELLGKAGDTNCPVNSLEAARHRATTCCKTCNGIGWETCEYCNGRGVIRDDEFQSNFMNNRIVVHLPIRLPHASMLKCPLCGGFRRERCSGCFGSGNLQVAARALEQSEAFDSEDQLELGGNDSHGESGTRGTSAARFRQLQRNAALGEERVPPTDGSSQTPQILPDSPI